MKLTATHYYLVLFLTTLSVVLCISVAYFYVNQREDIVTKATNSFSPSIIKTEDTLLSVQASENSGCQISGVLLTDDQLLALPQHEFTTLHNWAPTAETFRGPLLEDVLRLICNGAKSIELVALNDYSIAVNFELIKKYKPVVAHSINGHRLSIRNKGPLWIMFDHERYNIKTKNLEGMMIWQLSDIMVLSSDEKL